MTNNSEEPEISLNKQNQENLEPLVTKQESLPSTTELTTSKHNEEQQQESSEPLATKQDPSVFTTELITSQNNDYEESEIEKSPKKARAWPLWQLSAAFVMAVSGTLGFIATASLLKLPSASNCPQISWPWASASMRIYCAQLQAENKTPENLVSAIKQLQNLPSNHSLKSEVDENIKAWVAEILELGENQFQAGNLNEALAIARQVPPGLKYQNLVDAQIQNWQQIWNKAEQTYQNVQETITSRNWNRAFKEAVALTNIDNEYWSTTKYQETLDRIQSAKEDGTKLDNAYKLLDKGGLDDLLKAVEIVKTIESNSYAYKEAQDIVSQAKNKVSSQIDEFIDTKDWAGLSTKLKQIPPQLQLQEEIKDWGAFAEAGTKSASGTKADIELAILELEKMDSQRPLYFKAQELITRWRLEIEDITNLEKAQELAKPGKVEDLNAAIAQAQLISSFNPRYDQALALIKKWSNQVETIEDGPTLDKARQNARIGTPSACTEAINQASLIAPGRALYPLAQQVINQCQYGIQVQQDQPFLDQAMALGRAGDWQGAIKSAQQIAPGRALYKKAQNSIAAWQNELQAKQTLDRAYQTASLKTSQSLVEAISIAQKIPPSVQVKRESVGAINSWSEELLVMADLASSSSLEDAIAIARNIPSGTTAYYSARAKIDMWRRRLQPLPPLLTEPLNNP